jgi:diaminopimelate decarboxylase
VLSAGSDIPKPAYCMVPCDGGHNIRQPLSSNARNRRQALRFGPTCDSIDVVMKAVYMPEMQNGDWLLFPDTGKTVFQVFQSLG